MKKLMMLMMLGVSLIAVSANAAVILTGVIDGPYSGGHPKAVELYVNGTEDLTGWTVKIYTNGSTSAGASTTLSGTYADQYVYVMYDGNGAGPAAFADIWGTSGDFANVIAGAAPNHNGDDAIALHDDTGAIVDVYGVIGVDGTGTDWECLDSYAYRNNDTGPEITFNVSDWTVGAVNVLDGLSGSSVALLVPFGTYTTTVDPNVVDPNVPLVDYTYGWEDGYGHVLGGYGNVYKPQNTTEQVYSGSHALKVSYKPVGSGTSAKPFLGWVKNLQDGDRVDVELYAYDDTIFPDEGYHSSRIVADYTSSQDITDFFGYVSGGSEYTSGIGWEKLTATFYHYGSTLDGEPNAMLITAYLSADYDSDIEDYYFDDIKISAPEHAQVVLPPAYEPNNYTTYTYGWEDFDVMDPQLRETVLLNTYYNIQTGLQYDPTNVSTHTGTNAMWISENDPNPDGPTGEGHMAWITGLQNGDYINASCFGRSYPGLDGGSVRMWAHYTYDDQDIKSYAGSAGGYAGYSDPNGWTEFQKLYVFSDAAYVDADNVEHTPNGMVIEVRPYSTQGQGGYIDDITLQVPETATVTFPSPDGDAICVGGLPEWDFNADCIFNLLDLVTVIDDWLGCNLQPQEDCGL